MANYLVTSKRVENCRCVHLQVTIQDGLLQLKKKQIQLSDSVVKLLGLFDQLARQNLRGMQQII